MERIALVTGGTGGIGTAICRSLHDEGFHVVAGFCHGGDESYAEKWQAQQRQKDYPFEIAYADVTNYDSCGAMIKEIETKIGNVDILVNNAGVTKDQSFKKCCRINGMMS